MRNADAPKLEDQLCFPLYVISKEITALYRPLLLSINMTYSQYLVMMVLWENDGLTVNAIGEKLFLDSGTLTPLLKRLEIKKYISRQRKKEDERMVQVFLTKLGTELKKEACSLPDKMLGKLNFSDKEMIDIKVVIDQLYAKLGK